MAGWLNGWRQHFIVLVVIIALVVLIAAADAAAVKIFLHSFDFVWLRFSYE